MITIRIDDSGFKRDLERFARQNESGFKLCVLNATNEMEKMAKTKVRNYTARSKVKSSFLINNIHKQISEKGLTGAVISRAGYSQAFEEGTKPHVITIRTKKVLAGPYRGRPSGWSVSSRSKSMGYAVYGKRVQHPGTQPHPYMFPAWRHGCQVFEQNIMKMFR